MSYATRAITLALGVAIAGASIGAATANTRQINTWQHNHPWRVEVNHRLTNLNRRINVERREGELTGWQARALHREDRTIRHEERFMASFHDSHLTRAEHRALNQQENGLSRQIGR